VKIQTAILDPHSAEGRRMDILLAAAAGIAILATILQSVPSVDNIYGQLFTFLEVSTTILFTVEYCLRVYFTRPKAAYIFSFYGITDILAILPPILGIFSVFKALRSLRVIRSLRIVRLAKIIRLFLDTNHVKSKQLHLVNVAIYFMSLGTSVLLLASTLYGFEATKSYAYSTIPLAMIQAAKIIVGGLGQAATHTLAGELTVIIGRFVGLALFGLLITVIGTSLTKALFGGEIKK
jgi:voltage-gated potassium channel